MGELDPLIGRTISGRYRVHSLIGQGGMGKVFEAQQIPLGRSVALKVLGLTHAAESDVEFQQRFFHEAAILAKLKSPHTVTVFDYGRDGDTYFIAMELVPGKPLDRMLREQGVLSPAHAVSMAIQIARSLREAHALGVVHRDLKPANVLVSQTADGEENLKVLDFGLAKRLHVNTEETHRDIVPGSPKYMAPEVIRQEPVDGRADIYALGILIYHMVTGRVPFDAQNPLEILMAHVQQQPAPMALANPNVVTPPALEQLVMRCLAKRPEQRYSTMQEVIDALRALAGALGLGNEMGGLSMLPPAALATSSGSAHSPDGRPATSGQAQAPGQGQPVPRSSDAPRLRLDLDATPSGTQMKRGLRPTVKKLWLPFIIATACGVVGALAVSLALDHTSSANGSNVISTPLPAPPEPPPAPAQPTQAAPAPADQAAANGPTGDENTPMMDFTDQLQAGAAEKPAAATATTGTATTGTATTGGAGAPIPVAALPSIMITARSTPPGAAVIVRGTRMGLTPVTFRFQDRGAKAGAPLAVVFQLAGHSSKTVTKTIGGASLLVDAVLPKIAAQPRAPTPPSVEAEAVEEEPEADDEEEPAEDSLDDRTDRALRTLEGNDPEQPAPKDPVLKVTESE